MTYSIPSNYYSILANIESNDNPLAKAPTSSASGLFQFTRPTWEGLGGDWSQVFNVDLQQQMAKTLTEGNAQVLNGAGIPVNNSTLYGAHFLGAGTAVDVFNASPDTPISQIVSPSALHANPFMQNMSVGGFMQWLNSVTNPFRAAHRQQALLAAGKRIPAGLEIREA